MKKLFQVMLFLTVFLLLILLSPRGYAALSETLYVSVSDGGWLNGRAEPDKQADIECHFSNGDTVTVLEMENGWAKVDEGGEADCSYVKWDYLISDLNGSTPMTVASNGRVRLRDNPDGKEVTGYTENGDVVNVAFFFGGWAKTEKGWINADYLTDLN